MHLDRQAVCLETPLRRPRLGDRCQDVEQQRGLAACLIIGDGTLFIDQPRAIQVQREPAFNVGLLCEQHAAHVGMLDDRDLRLCRVLRQRMPSLRSLARIFQRVQVAGVAQHHCAEADADARLVHHVEHVGETLVLLADEITDCASLAARLELAFAEVQQAVGGAAITHLVIEAGKHDIVAFSERAVRVHQLLRHDEQRDAFHTRDQLAVLVRNLRKDEVNDVVRQLVLPGRNPHLVALEAIGAVRLRLGARDDVRQR